jgi:hypothetical protein
MHPVITDEDL